MYNIVIVNDIPPDIILAASCYYLKKKPNDVSAHYSFSSPDLECHMNCHHFVSIAVIFVVCKLFTFQSLLRNNMAHWNHPWNECSLGGTLQIWVFGADQKFNMGAMVKRLHVWLIFKKSSSQKPYI